MTPDQILVEVLMASDPSQRRGQAMMNKLYELVPDLARAIIGTSFDPFYDDDRIPSFQDHLATILVNSVRGR